MPHITIKMLKGRTDDQKKLAADRFPLQCIIFAKQDVLFGVYKPENL